MLSSGQDDKCSKPTSFIRGPGYLKVMMDAHHSEYDCDHDIERGGALP